MRQSVCDRFETKVQRGDGCHLWIAAPDDWGYGVFWDGSHRKKAHRWVWEQEHGPLDPGVLVLHSCDTPPCVRLDHLFVGSNADNMADMVAKGRSPKNDGERNPRAKLTWVQVDEIRARKEETVSALAREFCVTRTLIRLIRQGKIWVR